jgi:hypothetical protein
MNGKLNPIHGSWIPAIHAGMTGLCITMMDRPGAIGVGRIHTTIALADALHLSTLQAALFKCVIFIPK